MKSWSTLILGVAVGAMVLGAAIVSGYWNSRHAAKRIDRVAIGAPVSERQVLERRRGRAADVAIAASMN